MSILAELGPVVGSLAYAVAALLFLLVTLHTVVRIARHFRKFPMPQFLANAIDNPFRRRIQPPDRTPLRHGIEPGMTVLEVGPGSGTYTIATARRIGAQGRLVTVDIEERMIERVKHRAQTEGVSNIEAKVADVYDLPFADATFDAIYMIAVIGEIPSPEKALREFHRVLSPSGTIAFSELLLDPDYPLASTVTRKAAAAGFRLKRKIGNAFHYTLVFEKALPAAA
jgi:ubiquinone/menaquinone biosynthesis C-methylase UbiE